MTSYSLVFGDECLFETAKAVDGLLAQMELYMPEDNQLASIHRSHSLEYQPFEPVETVEPVLC